MWLFIHDDISKLEVLRVLSVTAGLLYCHNILVFC